MCKETYCFICVLAEVIAHYTNFTLGGNFTFEDNDMTDPDCAAEESKVKNMTGFIKVLVSTLTSYEVSERRFCMRKSRFN